MNFFKKLVMVIHATILMASMVHATSLHQSNVNPTIWDLLFAGARNNTGAHEKKSATLHTMLSSNLNSKNSNILKDHLKAADEKIDELMNKKLVEIQNECYGAAILSAIEKMSYDKILLYCSDTDLAKRFAASMRGNVAAKIIKNGAINIEHVKNFLAVHLEQRAIQFIKEHNKRAESNHQYSSPVMPEPSAPPAPAHVYTSAKCCICLDDYDETSVKRIVLSCGHDMCENDAKEWFFGKQNKDTCPQCRDIVAKQDIANRLYKN